MAGAGTSRFGRLCCRLAGAFSGGYKLKTRLARLTPRAYIAPSAALDHARLGLGVSVFIGDGVTIFGARDTGEVSIGDRACVHRDTIIESSEGGCLRIGADTHVQPRCHLSAHKGSIFIGSDVQVAPGCGFYPYDHGTALGTKMREQPVQSKGDIVVGNDVWIGFGAVILENVRIGNGAVVAAGSVVRDDVPQNAIVAGVPARIVGART